MWARKIQGYSSGLFYLKWSDLEWWEGNPNPIPTPTASKTQIFSFCMILLEQHSSQWTLCYGLVCLKGTQGKMWILHLKIQVHLLTGTILAVRCEINSMCSLLHNRLQIYSLIFFIHSSKNDSGAILLNCSAYHSNLLLLQPWVSSVCIFNPTKARWQNQSLFIYKKRLPSVVFVLIGVWGCASIISNCRLHTISVLF